VGAAGHPVRRLHPHHRREAQARRAAPVVAPARGQHARRPRGLSGHVRRVVLPPLRGLQDRRRAAPAGQRLPRSRASLRVDRGGELLLPPLGLPGLAGPGHHRGRDPHRARGAAQRGAGRDPAGAAGLQHQPCSGHLGHPGAGRPGPCLLRVDGRAGQLHHRPRVRGAL
jgi:hypothetical protein